MQVGGMMVIEMPRGTHLGWLSCLMFRGNAVAISLTPRACAYMHVGMHVAMADS